MSFNFTNKSFKKFIDYKIEKLSMRKRNSISDNSSFICTEKGLNNLYQSSYFSIFLK